MATYHSLLSTWNDYSSLISPHELDCSLAEHIADSISLVPYVSHEVATGKVYVDIGSGGGFPAIPVSVMLQTVDTMLVERNERKAAFLQKVCISLDLQHIEIVNASFPAAVSLRQPFVLTARAIEKPDILLDALVSIMKPESTFLRQTGRSMSPLPQGLRAEGIEDEFDTDGLRRGLLFKVTKS